MKLVSQYPDLGEAENDSSLLEFRGIATFISNRRANRLNALPSIAYRVGLWVVLDEQLNDALKLLSNQDHAVSNPLSRSEIIELKNSVGSGNLTQVLRFLVKMLLIVSLVALAVGAVVFIWPAD
jgi:hypothetical protein